MGRNGDNKDINTLCLLNKPELHLETELLVATWYGLADTSMSGEDQKAYKKRKQLLGSSRWWPTT